MELAIINGTYRDSNAKALAAAGKLIFTKAIIIIIYLQYINT